MPTIRQLPPAVINKIAAGEVIERPASVVKELMENAVDAGATRIEVVLESGGLDLVRVADDGCGIEPDQLHLAIASHATSKILDADDLFEVESLGFRGEALASIAEISHFLIRTRTDEANSGFELEVRGGSPGSAAPCGCPVGTMMEVRNLFFNTPVRRKFMRTPGTELSHCTEAFLRIALPHPDIHFTLKHKGRVLHDLPAVSNWRERIGAISGHDIAAALIGIDSVYDEIHLQGYVAAPEVSRGNTKMQYLFLNGRHIRDRALGHALGEAYRGLLLTGRHPVAYLRFQMPPSAVDVNVHPTKLEVRFQDGGKLYSQLLGSLRKKFLTTNLTTHVNSGSGNRAVSAAAPGAGGSDSGETAAGSLTGQMPGSLPAGASDEALERHRRELVNWAKGQLPAAGDRPPAEHQPGLPLEYEPRPQLDLVPIARDGSYSASQQQAGAQATGAPTGADDVGAPLAMGQPVGAGQAQAPPQSATAPWRATAMQVHNRYLVAEENEGMVVIDQHALHERILYERFREKALRGAVETQRLLTPEVVTLTPAEAAALLEEKDTLERAGVQIEAFSGDSILVSGYPAMLPRLDPTGMIREIAAQLTAGGQSPGRRELLDDLLNMMSCKAAVKAGDPLTPEEIQALLEQRHLCQDSHHCPHGRPTSLVFTRDQLDRMFKRH